MRLQHPSTTTLELAPQWDGLSNSRPGSALRFFQPLSGFQADSSFVALFHATAVRVSPFRVFPSQESPTLSGQANSPVVIHQRAVTTPTRDHDTFGFTYSHAFARLHGSPVTGIRSCLSTSRSSLPDRHLDHEWAKPLRFASFTYFEALILSRVRSRRRELPRDRRSILSWATAPLKFFPRHLGISNPPGVPSSWPTT